MIRRSALFLVACLALWAPACLGQTTISSSYPPGGSSAVDARIYGVLCNGVHDDTLGIQTGVSASSISGADLVLPPGICPITPTAPPAFYTFAYTGGFRLRGAGKDRTILRVQNGAGPYYGLFGDTGGSIPFMSGVWFEDFTIDQNTSNNGFANANEYQTAPRIAIALVNGWRQGIRRVGVINGNGVNQFITLAQVSDVEISDCTFQMVADPNGFPHDTSSIYSVAPNTRILNNYFLGDGPNGLTSNTAIETHASKQVIQGNHVSHYNQMANVTGVDSVSDTYDQTVIGNTGDNLGVGCFQLWSEVYAPHNAGYGLDGVTVSGNTCNITQHAMAAGTTTYGVAIEAAAGLPVRNIAITGNTIAWQLDATDIVPNTASLGIGWLSINNLTGENITIANNVLLNMPMAGIRWSAGCVDCSITGNILRNVGSTLDAQPAAYHAPIFLAPLTASKNITVSNNLILDDLATTRIVTALDVSGPGTAIPGFTFTENVIQVTGGTQTAYTNPFIIDNTSLPVYKGTISGTKNWNGTPGVGSEIWKPDETRKFTFNGAGGADTWVATRWATAVPADGLYWSVGSIVWNSTPAHLGAPCWICTTAGTNGTWYACPSLL